MEFCILYFHEQYIILKTGFHLSDVTGNFKVQCTLWLWQNLRYWYLMSIKIISHYGWKSKNVECRRFVLLTVRCFYYTDFHKHGQFSRLLLAPAVDSRMGTLLYTFLHWVCQSFNLVLAQSQCIKCRSNF